MAIEIRLLEESELEIANNFFNTIYKTNRSIDNFKWEFLEGPFGKAIYVIAIDNSKNAKVIGIQCAIPIELVNPKGEKVLTAKSEDTLVDPEYRGQKIFERMYDLLFLECKKAGIHYIWGFTPAKKAFERIGFDVPFKTEQALLVFKPFKSYRYLKQLNPNNKAIDNIKIFVLSLFSWLKGKGVRNSRSEFKLNGTSIEETNTFGQFYKNENYFTLHLTPTYLNWRLARNPFKNTYQSYSIVRNDNLILSSLINIRESVSYIEQMFYDNEDNAKIALNKLVLKIKHYNSPLIRVLCFNNNEKMNNQKKLLEKAGFTLLKRGNYFVWKNISEHTNLALKPEQLFITRLFTQGNQ